MNLTSALKWSFFSELVAKTIQPLVFIVLTHFLMPEDFGVMTAAMMVIAFSQIFWDAGMGKSLIQRHTYIKEAANAAFLINIGLGALISGLLYLLAQPIAQTFFHDDRVTSVLKIMTLHVLFSAFCSVQISLLQKEMNFKKLFWIRFVTVSLPGLASIALAWIGLGYWALVTGTLVGQLSQAIMLWWISSWRPSFNTNSAVTKEISRFGGWVCLTGLLVWFYAWADSLVLGHFLGSHELGLYSIGSQFVSPAFSILFAPILPVLYSHLSQLKKDKDKMRITAEVVISILSVIAIPISIFFFAYAHEFQEVIFGEKWIGIDVVIAAMAMMYGYSWIVGLNGEFYRAIGKPNYETIVTASSLLAYLGVYLYIVNEGLALFVWARMGLAMVTLSLHIALLNYLLRVNVYNIAKRILMVTAISTFSIYSIKYGVGFFFKDAATFLIVGSILSALLAMASLFFLEKNNTSALLLSFIKRDKE